MSSASSPIFKKVPNEIVHSMFSTIMFRLVLVFILITGIVAIYHFAAPARSDLTNTTAALLKTTVILGIVAVAIYILRFPQYIAPLGVAFAALAALAAISYFMYYMSAVVNYTPIVVNSILIILFCLSVAAAVIATIGPTYVFEFAAQTGIANIMLLVIALALALAFIPHTFTTAHPRIIMSVIAIVTLCALLFTHTPATLAFVTPYKFAMIITAIAFISILWYNNPADIFNSTFIKNNATFAIIIGIYMLCLAAVYMVDLSGILDPTVYRALNIGAGIVTSSLFFIWLMYLIMHRFSTHSGVTGVFILIAAIFVAYSLIATIFRFITINDGSQARENAFYSLLNNTILYLPCMFDAAYAAMIRKGVATFGYKTAAATASAAANIKNTPVQFWSLLIIAIGLGLAFYYMPAVNSKLYIGSGKQLLTDPITMNGATTVASYSELMGINDADASGGVTNPTYDYKYGISMWYYLDAYGANMNEAYNKYTPIFNYGNKPSIEYNGRTNSLRIRIGSTKGEPVTVFEQTGAVQLQKWTNIVVNFIGGTVDVFVDGQLLKSTGGVIPYMSMDNVVIGTQYGLYGKCCNVIYSASPFTAAEMYYLRYLVKDSNPPVFTGNIFHHPFNA